MPNEAWHKVVSHLRPSNARSLSTASKATKASVNASLLYYKITPSQMAIARKRLNFLIDVFNAIRAIETTGDHYQKAIHIVHAMAREHGIGQNEIDLSFEHPYNLGPVGFEEVSNSNSDENSNNEYFHKNPRRFTVALMPTGAFDYAFELFVDLKTKKILNFSFESFSLLGTRYDFAKYYNLPKEQKQLDLKTLFSKPLTLSIDDNMRMIQDNRFILQDYMKAIKPLVFMQRIAATIANTNIERVNIYMNGFYERHERILTDLMRRLGVRVVWV